MRASLPFKTRKRLSCQVFSHSVWTPVNVSCTQAWHFINTPWYVSPCPKSEPSSGPLLLLPTTLYYLAMHMMQYGDYNYINQFNISLLMGNTIHVCHCQMWEIWHYRSKNYFYDEFIQFSFRGGDLMKGNPSSINSK